MTKKVKRIISFSAMGLILAIALTASILAGIFAPVISNFLYGRVNFVGTEQVMQEGDILCQEIEAEGVVMLKNEKNALPLTDVKKVNVFGWSATDNGFVISGSGSGSADERGETTKKKLLAGLTDAGFEYNKSLISMYEKFKDKREGTSLEGNASKFFRLYEPGASAYTTAVLTEAVDFSNTAIIVISRLGGESMDLPTVQYKSSGTDSSRTYLELSTEEEALIETVTGAGFEKVIAIINTCNAMELGFLENAGIQGAISIGAPGQSGMVAVGKILRGEITPSGKTVDTYAYDHKSDPAFVNAGGQGVTNYTNSDQYIDYAEGIYVGYRYYETAAKEGYIDYKKVVQYPFGYGLSYTKFSRDVVSVTPDAGSNLLKDSKIKITVDVTNNGDKYSGQDVVQVYMTAPYIKGEIEKPYVQLMAFAKTSVLKPGETERLNLQVDISKMASYDVYDKNKNGFKGYELDKGAYELKVQSDSHNLIEDEKSKTIFNIQENIQYENDTKSGNKVENLFTGDTAYGGVSIDGENSSANIKFMTRANFTDTFPKSKAAARARSANVITAANKLIPTENNTTVTPTQNSGGSLSLTKTENGKLVMNDELVQALGQDYENEQWELLLNQLTVSELNNLVELAGYRTAEAKSIGKVEAIDLDGPSGLNQVNMSAADSRWNCYPVETVLASTWSARLSYTYGLAVGKEASVTSVSGWYAPAVNIHRSPFDGRNFEYYSEDPLLSGVMGAETTRGATANGLYCYVKHFAVNETETGRTGLYTWLDEQTLREIYLRPFEITVKEGGANAIMSSFNRLGAVWTGGNYSLLTRVLRNEWDFKGSVVTDWTTGGGYMNVDQGIRAGNDCWLSGMNYVTGHDDKNSATAISCARQAAKNMLFTYCNTYYIAVNHDSSQDKFVAEKGLKETVKMFPYWVFGIVAIDLAAVAGVGVWLYFLVIKKPKNKDKADA